MRSPLRPCDPMFLRTRTSAQERHDLKRRSQQESMDSAWALRRLDLRAGNAHREQVSLVELRAGRNGGGFYFRDSVRHGIYHRLHFGAPETASSLDVVCSTVALDDWRRDWRFDYTVRRLHLHCDVFADWNGVCHDRRRDRGVARPVFKAEALERNNRGLRRISSSAHRSMGAERSLREGDTQCEHFY